MVEEVDVDVQVPIDELGTEARAEGCRRRVKLSPRLHVALANKKQDSTSLLLLSLFDHPTRSHGISRVNMELHHASSFSDPLNPPTNALPPADPSLGAIAAAAFNPRLLALYAYPILGLYSLQTVIRKSILADTGRKANRTAEQILWASVAVFSLVISGQQ